MAKECVVPNFYYSANARNTSRKAQDVISWYVIVKNLHHKNSQNNFYLFFKITSTFFFNRVSENVVLVSRQVAVVEKA